MNNLFIESGKIPVHVVKKLGEGGQGSVHLVKTPHGDRALKWYNHVQATEEQKNAIRDQVRSGPPHGGQRFLWPEALVVTSESQQFGYLMPLIDKKKFAELGEVQSGSRKSPCLLNLCRISRHAAQSYQALHLSGLCYRDISQGNLLFNPEDGEVLICDNDNVGADKASECQVAGTMEFMAPEILVDNARPSTETDRHSLAVLLFNLWVWHHPMHGQLEYVIRSWDIQAKRRIYGETPVFIFDPYDRSNSLPVDPDYKIASDRWKLCPGPLQKLFIKAFTVGLKNPSKRVTEGEWERCLLKLEDANFECTHCRATNIHDVSIPNPFCWHCRKSIDLPPRLAVHSPIGNRQVLLTLGRIILKRHVVPGAVSSDDIIGEVVSNPLNPAILGIRNATNQAWRATFPDGTIKDIPIQRSCPLNPGTIISFGYGEAEIQFS